MAETGRRRERVGSENESEAAGMFAHLFSCFLLTALRDPRSERDGGREDGGEARGQ